MAHRLSRRELFPVLPRILPTKVTCVVTHIDGEILGLADTGSIAVPGRTIREGFRQLGLAQKPAARSAPAYSRFVNRRIGRALAAVCWALGLSPNAVTVLSAAFTFSAIALLALAPLGWPLGLAVGTGLLVGYALDSADGQVARLTGRSSPAGEWLDHVIDAAKASALPLALTVGLYRNGAVAELWLLVPIAASVVNAVLFFSMILTEQLRRQYSRVPVADHALTRATSRGWLRSVLVLPMDYGFLCLSFLLLGVLPAFLVLYTAIVVATAAFLLLAAGKWFSELRTVVVRA